MIDNSVKPSLMDSLRGIGQILTRYVVLWFALLLIAVYGYVAYNIVLAQGAQPSDADISAEVQATPVPHVDPNVVSQLQGLQDHSVNVQTLFDQARSNPFQE